MANQFMRVDKVAEELGISKSFAYKLIRQLNQELKERGGPDNRRQDQPGLFKGVSLYSGK